VIEPYNAAWEKRGGGEKPKLPVIFSHGCYAGIGTLDDLVEGEDCEDDNWHSGSFNAWNINLCDEDVRQVFASEGLIGVCFDQRIAGRKPKENVPEAMLADIILRHIFAFVDVIMLDDRIAAEEKAKVWDCVMIGSDYDGLIDPVSCFPTAMAMDDFSDALERELRKRSHTRQIDEIGVEVLVEKICWRNGYDFALRHLPKK
ncbi:MAG: hypothetical protein KC561_12285, partial [Myxococcales bacterium]|nr:hypothetical protein [Myxococcales bacterium]